MDEEHFHVVVDCGTGDVSYEPLTGGEAAESARFVAEYAAAAGAARARRNELLAEVTASMPVGASQAMAELLGLPYE